MKILVTISALGLGIDYAHVRFVIHQGQSRSLIDFSQESGRGGRDGKEARSMIFTSKEMRQKCEWIEKKESEWAGHLTGGFKADERVGGRENGGGHKGMQKSRLGLVHGRKRHELSELEKLCLV